MCWDKKYIFFFAMVATIFNTSIVSKLKMFLCIKYTIFCMLCSYVVLVLFSPHGHRGNLQTPNDFTTLVKDVHVLLIISRDVQIAYWSHVNGETQYRLTKMKLQLFKLQHYFVCCICVFFTKWRTECSFPPQHLRFWKALFITQTESNDWKE